MSDRENDIAVIGMSCRFPGAHNVPQFWANVCAGVESISFFTDEELIAAGVSRERLERASYVRANGALKDAYGFDASFFGMNETEAIVTDPQHRVFLECAWSALEDAGCDPARFHGSVGVFAGSGANDHYARLLADSELMSTVGRQAAYFGNSKDFLTTRVSYKLGLRGPSLAVQTACSTSLVAIHLACQSLLNHECDIALAGGVSIASEQVAGYEYQEGGILSPDGHCRAFDARAAGTVSGSGAGVVALKRFSDAQRDGNAIHAVVKGSAINNDGMDKIGFTAPGVAGQVEVISEALALADVDPSSVGYIEAHGTGTSLGDPIEIAALAEVFKAANEKRSCALGAVKTNFGHLDSAAGVAGFIKTVLALKHRLLPPTLHFHEPNPETRLQELPFYVNTALSAWRGRGTPLRAGVSSFGIGGTNAHVVLEEAPEFPPLSASDEPHLFVLSAKSEKALAQMRDDLGRHIETNPSPCLADIERTLREGRSAHPHRWAAVVRTSSQAREALFGNNGTRSLAGHAPEAIPPVTFLFPGQGSQYAGMARHLYSRHPVFRNELDRCAGLLAKHLDVDLRAAMFPEPGRESAMDEVLQQTRYTQPALFALEYSLAKLWMSWGVQPESMLGHSIGEFAAACIADVFSLENAIQLVAARGRLIQSLPPGAMLAVPMSGEEISQFLSGQLSLAAVNSSLNCAVSGPAAEVVELKERLAGRGIAAREIKTSHAFHSAAMDPILAVFAGEVRKANPRPPQIPFVSNVTGDWITEAEAADPTYWARHLRMPVRFADGLRRVLDGSRRVLLEVGPGHTLSSIASREAAQHPNALIVSSLGSRHGGRNSDESVLEAVGSLWTVGVKLDWAALSGASRGRLLHLPGYPFEHTEYRLRRAARKQSTDAAAAVLETAVAANPPSPARVPLETGTLSHNRLPAIATRVSAIFARLLGVPRNEIESSRTFLQLGADSLLLMQASRSMETEFGVRIPFRLLLEELSTIHSLSLHLNHALPLEAGAPHNVSSAPAAEVSSSITLSKPLDSVPVGISASGINSIVEQQLAIMRVQLEVLRGQPSPQVETPLVVPAVSVGGPDTARPDHALPVSHGPHRPVSQTIHEGSSLDDGQARYFNTFVARFNARTHRSKRYAADNRRHLADNRAVLGFRLATKELLYPIVSDRSEGSRLWDLDGNEYVDFTCGFGVHFFGHRPTFITEAIQEQLRRGFHLGPQSDLAGSAAELFCEITGKERVTFCTTGSEAVMSAIRMARAATARDRIVVFEGAYHGTFDGVLARRRGGDGNETQSVPVGSGTPQNMVDDVVVLRYGAEESLEWLRRNIAGLAAVLVEPIQTRNPELQPREFLHQLRSLADQAGTVLIFDEVVTGFRLGPKGAQGLYGVEADLATYGKVLGGGFPIGAIAGRASLMDLIDGGSWNFSDDSFPASEQIFFAGTFSKHPFTMAAVRAALGEIRSRGTALYDELNARCARLVAGLHQVVAEEQVPIRVVSCGSMFSVRAHGQSPFANLLFYHLVERGIYIWEQRSCFLSTAHTDEDCDRFVEALRSSIRELREAGCLPGLPVAPSIQLTAATPTPKSFPLTPSQRNIWIHAQLGDDASRAYNEQIVFSLPDVLDLTALRAALEDVMLHHESLRTVFDPSGELQHVQPVLPVVVRVEPPLEPCDGQLALALNRAVHEVFDLRLGPLFRVHVHSVADAVRVQVVFHHIIMDVLGAETFLRDLRTAYAARREAHIPQLPAVMQFREYSILLTQRAEAQAAREPLWLAQFEGAAPLLLPTDRPRPPFPSTAAALATLSLPTGLVSRLRSAGRRDGRTLLMTVLAGVAATLHRLADQNDLVIGVPAAGRPFPGSESMAGQCVDVLPIRSRITESTLSLQLLNDVRRSLLDAYEFDTFSLAYLSQRLNLPHGPGAPPLLSVVVNMEPAGENGPGVSNSAGEKANRQHTANLLSKFDITLDIVERSDTLDLRCLYQTNLFDQATIDRILQSLRRILEQIADETHVPVSQLDLMPAEDRYRILHEWNRTAADYPRTIRVHQWFEQQVRQTPDRIAVMQEAVSLSYRELNRRANQLAHCLRERGLTPDTRVAICLDRGLEMFVALLGVLKSGAAYVPLDPAHPKERQAYILDDSAAGLLISQTSLAGALPTHSVPTVWIDGDSDELARQPGSDLIDGESLDHVAYVLYTSGSTGKPKGVEITRRSLMNFLATMQRAPGIRSEDRVLALTTLTFDIAGLEIFLPLVSGASVVVAAREEQTDAARLTALLERSGITLLQATPTTWRLLLEAGWTGSPNLNGICGGEALSRDLADQLTARCGNVWNGYGPTETTVYSTIFRLMPGADAFIPIGGPVANTRVYVLAPHGEPVPVGVAGELYIGGDGVARGYRNRPGLTAAKFVPDPFAVGERIFRTGDRVRWREDGALEFFGRFDDQVKIRGFRIELGEIEARLGEIPGVRQAVVVAREDGSGDKRLVAYYTCRDVGAVELGAVRLRAELSVKLPDYMLPAAYVQLPELPLTSSGKLDRKALPEPKIEVVAPLQDDAPQTVTEELVAAIWCEVLKLDRVGRNADFFALGGHSLTAFRVLARLRQALNVEIGMRDLFLAPALSDLARALDSAVKHPLPQITRATHDEAIPLSSGQKRLWFLAQIPGASQAYHIPFGFRLCGSLDSRSIKAALDSLLDRHQVLRTTFALSDGQPVQRIRSHASFSLLEHDLRQHSDPEAELARLAREEARMEFDLEGGPLIRGRLIRTADDEHAVLITMHHIVADAWSIRVFLREFSVLYTAAAQDQVNPLLEPEYQYADYAIWQQGPAVAEILHQHAEYWQAALNGAPALLELPTDRPRSGEPDFSGDHVQFVLDRELTASLTDLSRRHGATLYMTLLAAWAALLSRLAGQNDVVIGTPVANRTRLELENLVGLFANTVALRFELGDSPDISELLSRVKAQVLAAQQHQDIPFERVVEIMQPARSLAHSPVFQVMFAWQHASEGRIELPGLQLRPLAAEAPQQVAKFDLTLSLHPLGGETAGILEYAAALFEKSTIERYLNYYRRLLQSMVKSDRQILNDVGFLDDAERHQLLSGWNQTDRPYPAGTCIHEALQQQAEQTPDAVAIIWGAQSLTYAELNRRANRLANYLAGQGIGAESRVGVMLERGVDLIISLAAIVKAGAAYVPLDLGYPAERLAFMLEDSDVRVVVTQTTAATKLLPIPLSVICLDQCQQALTAQPDTPPQPGITPENMAYIVYTSGSTGKPKGVVITHRGVLQLVVKTDYVQLRPGDRVAQASNASFDALTFEAWGALLNGATLVGIDKEVLLSPPALARYLRSQNITTLYQTTALLNELSRHQNDIFAGIREVLFGGQSVDPGSVRRILKSGKPERLLHMYGPTETTAWCSYEAIEHVEEEALTVTVGRPTGNQRVYILCANYEPAPLAVGGEAYVGGAGLARGYLSRPALTAERFVPNPFGPEPGARMYRTGDRLRWRANGVLEFLGRLDEQVKIRGYRIELGEIESRLASGPGVGETVVTAVADSNGDQRLVAYYTASGAAPAIEQLRAHLASALPDYMIPAAFVRLDALPLTPNGKVDHRQLPAPERRAFTAGYEPPQTIVEDMVAAIWNEVLKIDSAGRHDNFFELGGHSLLAVQVLVRLRQALNVEIGIRDLFEHPVLSDLAHILETAARMPLPAITRADRNRPLPLSFAQQRLWFLAQMPGVSEAYHVPFGVRLRGPLDPHAVRQALDRVVARHEALRTTFSLVDGEPVQSIHPEGHFQLLEHDLRQHPEHEAKLACLIQEERRTHFDMEAGPLIRGRLIQIADHEHILLVTMHHIVSDGWSVSVLLREVTALYRAFTSGAADPLPALPLQYADYAQWQRTWIESEPLAAQAEYWKSNLAGAPEVLELPADRPRPAAQVYAGAQIPFVLDQSLTAALTKLSNKHGTTLYMTLLAAWALLLSRLSGQQEVVIGTPVANRGRLEVENLIGFFVNMLALRIDVAGSGSVAELLAHVKSQALAAQQHQDLSFEQVVELARPPRSLAHTPIFQVMFSWQNTPEMRLDLPGLELGPLRSSSPQQRAKYDLTFSLQPSGGRILGGLEYATALFDESTVERYLGYYRTMLEAMAGDPQEALDRLPLMGEAELQIILRDWNQTGFEYPSDKCLHQLFEQQVRRTPGATAVASADRTLTYAELNKSANRLARHLKDAGVKPDDRVAICLERGSEMIVTVLSVLKAGAAYIPLDPAYPKDRLAYILEDSAASLLVSQTSLADSLPSHPGKTLWLDAERSSIALQPETDGVTPCDPQSNAYVLYTSGSTGRPKGVEIVHSNVVNFLASMQEVPGISPQDTVLALTTLSFDIAGLEIYLPLVVGARIVVATGEQARHGRKLVELIDSYDVTLIQATPAGWRLLLESGWTGKPGLKALCGGEALPRELADKLASRCGELWNMYGPTETTIWSTLMRVAPGAEAVVPIGRPIGNTQVYVLDANQLPVPIGVSGELYIGGHGVGRGYLNRTEMTREKFLPAPFAGGRMYRTGDRVRWRPDATLEFLGRLDQQVKIRGFRIELGEVENALATCPGVREARVIVREDIPGDRRLVAYLASAVDVEPLRASLRQSLPEYMVPTAFVTMERLPLTPNGKLDLRALPAPEYVNGSKVSQGPRNPAELQLLIIWEDLLGIAPIGVTDDFFDLGGHSLLATRLFTEVKNRMGCELPIATLFGGATVRQMAAEIHRLKGAPATADPVVALQPHGNLPTLFCIHPAGRDVYVYVRLAHHLGGTQPVSGVPDLHQNLARPLTQIAAEHVAAIRRIQPEGPYYLLGWSFGGAVAYEMAVEFERQQQTVAFLGVLDTLEPGAWNQSEEMDDATLAAALAFDVADQMGKPFSLTPEELRNLPFDDQLRHAVAALHDQGAAPYGYGASDLREACKTIRARDVSRNRYSPGVFSGKVTLFRARDVRKTNKAFSAWMDSWTEEERRTYCWSRRVPGRVDVLLVPGTHAGMCSEPNVRSLAAYLRESLAAARERAEEAANLSPATLFDAALVG